MSSGEALSAQEAAAERARGGPWAPAAPREARRWRRPGDPKLFNVRHPKVGSERTFGSCTAAQPFFRELSFLRCLQPPGDLPRLRSAFGGHPQTHFCPAGLRRSATACALLGHMEAPKGSDRDRSRRAGPLVPAGARRLAGHREGRGARPPAISGLQPLDERARVALRGLRRGPQPGPGPSSSLQGRATPARPQGRPHPRLPRRRAPSSASPAPGRPPLRGKPPFLPAPLRDPCPPTLLRAPSPAALGATRPALRERR